MVAVPLAPAAEISVDSSLVRALVQSQFPEASAFALGDRYEGADCVTWRLGTDWAVRLSRRQATADMQETELTWLPRFAPTLPCATPAPVRIGAPSALYPWRWSIVRWIPGRSHHEQPLSAHGARDLGVALRALHQAAPPEAPRNAWRSTSLLQRGAKAQRRLDVLTTLAAGSAWRLDREAALAMYARGAHATRGPATWTHLDLHCGNVLTTGGRLAGIVDWVHAGAGDGAADLGQAMVLLPPSHWDHLIDGYGPLDVATFDRARAEALTYALILATTPSAPFTAAGWTGLVSLGIAHRAHATSPRPMPAAPPAPASPPYGVPTASAGSTHAAGLVPVG